MQGLHIISVNDLYIPVQCHEYTNIQGVSRPYAPLSQPKLETSAVNHKRALQIHLLNLIYVKNDGSQPTFSVFFSRLAETL